MPYTSNKKPGGLDAASSVGNDTIVIEQSGSVLKATVSQLEDRVFGAKTAVTSPDGSEAVVVRTSGNLIRQVALSNIVPALNITDAKVAAAAAIAGTKISPNFGSQTVQTTGQVSTGSLAVSGNTTMGGTLVVTGALTANGGINATITGTSSSANQLTNAANIAATGDINWNVNFNGATNQTAEATIQPNVVTDAKLRTGGACSVVGRSANSTGNVADIAASADNQVLRRVSGALGFSTIPTGCIADDAVTDTKLRDSAGLSVIGRSGNSTGNPADIVAGTDGHALRLSGTTLGFGQIATAGIADSAVTIAKLAAAVQQALLPAGAVQAFAMNSAPAGWLAANGNEYDKTGTYATLFAAISTTYGETNGSGGAGTSHFRVPDLRGYFVRGSGTNSDTTAAGTFGAKIADTLKSHTHTGTTSVDGSHAHAYAAYLSIVSKSTTPSPTGSLWDGLVNRATESAGDHSHTFTTGATGSGETAPRNIAMLYCIKF
jgi:microcystin-dependent protein